MRERTFSHHEQCPRCAERGADSRKDNLGVYSDGGMFCFSCGWNRPPTYLKTREQAPRIYGDDKALLPFDFSREIPTTAWKWLLQYGLGYKYWLPFVGWTETYSRLVFTIGDPVEFSIGRYIEIPGDKRTGPPRKWYAYGNCHKAPHILGDIEKAKRIVLVEDLISAHKVSQVQPAIALFGTDPTFTIGALKHLKLPVVMWLDADQQAGIASKAARLSVYTGAEVSYVFSDRDPKANSLEEIEKKVLW